MSLDIHPVEGATEAAADESKTSVENQWSANMPQRQEIGEVGEVMPGPINGQIEHQLDTCWIRR